MSTKRLNANIPAHLHEEFKVQAILRHVDMQSVLTDLIRVWVNTPVRQPAPVSATLIAAARKVAECGLEYGQTVEVPLADINALREALGIQIKAP